MRIDLNADLGEAFGSWKMGDDDAMLRIVTSANIACGFHAGDPQVMLARCEQAAAAGVRIGAHIGFPDLVGFGRRIMDASADEVFADTIYQLGALRTIARSVGSDVRYVKPHGALYHSCNQRADHAHAVVRAICQVDPTIGVLGFPGSQLLAVADAAGLVTQREYFIDRGYDPEGRLIERGQPGALIGDFAEAARRAIEATRAGVADSMCIHGDSPGAVAMGEAVRDALIADGITLAAPSDAFA